MREQTRGTVVFVDTIHNNQPPPMATRGRTSATLVKSAGYELHEAES